MSDSRTVADELAEQPILAPLGPAALERLAERGVSRRLARGQVLFTRGQRDGLALVHNGRLAVCRDLEDGTRMILRYLSSGSLVGISTVSGGEHSADIEAAEACEVVVFPPSVVADLLLERPEIAVAAVAHLADLVSRLTEELEELRIPALVDRTLARLRRLYTASGGRTLAITHDELAAHLGAERANVSRALAELEERGSIRRGWGQIEWIESENDSS